MNINLKPFDGTSDRWEFHRWNYTVSQKKHKIKTDVNYFIKQEIRSVELGVCPVQLFHFWSRDVHPVQNLLLCKKISSKSDDFSLLLLVFSLRYGDVSIFRWRWSAVLESFYHHMRPPTKSLLLATTACQILCQSDAQISRHSYLNFSHIWLEMPIRPPKWEFWGTLNP